MANLFGAYASRVDDSADPRRPDLLDVERTGTVGYFKDEKGDGSITADDGEVLFVHSSGIADQDEYRPLVAGKRVQFV